MFVLEEDICALTRDAEQSIKGYYCCFVSHIQYMLSLKLYRTLW